MGTHVASDALRIQMPCFVTIVYLPELQLIMLGCIYHVINVPMNSVWSLVEGYKSKCVVVPVCNHLADKCPLVFGQYF